MIVFKTLRKGALLLLLLAFASVGLSEDGQFDAILGRWDVTVTTGSVTFPSWFEFEMEGDELKGRLVGRIGSARPITKLSFDGENLDIALPPQFEEQDTDVVYKGKLERRRIVGEMLDEKGNPLKFTAVRAPKLDYREVVKWGEPVSLLRDDLSNWKLRVAEGPDGWKYKDGILSNTPPSVDLISKETFKDFKLHIEYRLPPRSNSGIYLRGRYEIQVNDPGDRPPSKRLNSAIYGFIAPSEMAANPPGEWNVYDVTLIGRWVTVVLNGKTIIDHKEIPGITGGAVDSHEAKPGPLMLQGDHRDVGYRNIVITPAVSYKLSQEVGEGALMAKKPAVKLGVDMLFEKHLDVIKGKKVGLITNPTGVDSRLRSTADLLASHPDVDLVALFGPEHGIRGGVSGSLGDSVDANTNVTVYSLYGRTRKPTEEMLKDIDVLLFDIQDIGSRSYTYISTMKHSMDAAAEHKVKFVVLDRPNPVNGVIVEGPMIEEEFYSFIGVGPVAYMHGMTVGELAQFFNKEMNVNCDLEVVKMEGWKREMTWRDTGLVWVPTSPHIPEGDSSWFYPITGIFGETPLVSIGVGYTLPFKLVGAPWMNAGQASKAMNDKNIPGVYFEAFFFRPYYRHYQGEICEGFRIIITDEKKIKPVVVGYHITEMLIKMYPEKFDLSKTRVRGLDLANGSDKIRLMFQDGVPVEKIIESYQPGVKEFLKIRQKYLLY